MNKVFIYLIVLAAVLSCVLNAPVRRGKPNKTSKNMKRLKKVRKGLFVGIHSRGQVAVFRHLPGEP